MSSSQSACLNQFPQLTYKLNHESRAACAISAHQVFIVCSKVCDRLSDDLIIEVSGSPCASLQSCCCSHQQVLIVVDQSALCNIFTQPNGTRMAHFKLWLRSYKKNQVNVSKCLKTKQSDALMPCRARTGWTVGSCWCLYRNHVFYFSVQWQMTCTSNKWRTQRTLCVAPSSSTISTSLNGKYVLMKYKGKYISFWILKREKIRIKLVTHTNKRYSAKTIKILNI